MSPVIEVEEEHDGAHRSPGGSPGVSGLEPGPASGPGLAGEVVRTKLFGLVGEVVRTKLSGLAPSAMHFLSLWERVRAYYHTITAPLSKLYRVAEKRMMVWAS